MRAIMSVILTIVLSVASATAGIRHYCDYSYDGMRRLTDATYSESGRIRYMKTVMQIDANGDTVYVEQPAYKTIYRYYVGNSVRENNAPTRFYTEDGYFEYYRGVATFHYYVRDYLGSINN